MKVILYVYDRELYIFYNIRYLVFILVRLSQLYRYIID